MSVVNSGRSITGTVVSTAVMLKLPTVNSPAASVAVHVILCFSNVRSVALKSCPKFLAQINSWSPAVTRVLFLTSRTGWPVELSIHSNDSTPTWSVEFAM